MSHDYLHKSLLFVPGHRPDQFNKALERSSFVCIDLEDAVPPSAKAGAREQAGDFLSNLASETRARVAVRINGGKTQDTQADLAVLPSGLGAVMVPMVETVEVLQNAWSASSAPIIALVETPLGVHRAMEFAAQDFVCALMFGGADFAATLGIEMAWEPLLQARSLLAMAAGQYGRAMIDVPFLDIKDEDSLVAECERVMALGFTAKAAIHPTQVATIDRVFQPSPKDIAAAKRIIAVFNESDGAAQLLDGKMIEAPVIKRAQDLIKRAG